jgi:hypothetical protein
VVVCAGGGLGGRGEGGSADYSNAKARIQPNTPGAMASSSADDHCMSIEMTATRVGGAVGGCDGLEAGQH